MRLPQNACLSQLLLPQVAILGCKAGGRHHSTRKDMFLVKVHMAL